MPIYQYKCPTCNEQEEILQKTTDPPPVCQKCQVEKIKQISTTNFQLLGGGWYKDLYQSKPK